MEVIIIGVIIVVVVFVVWMKMGRLGFWQLAGKHPEEAYRHFKDNPRIWTVIENEEDQLMFDAKRKNAKEGGVKSGYDWSGPYRLAVPSINRVVKIYGNSESYEKDQKKLEEQLKNLK